MRARIVTLVIAAAPLLSLGGCYRTVVRSQAPAAGPQHRDRQWFLLAGAVDLSDPAGDECGGAGVAHAESFLSGMDILIDVGLSIAGASAGVAVCDKDADPEDYAACVSALGSIPPFLIGSRTVEYQCAAGASGLAPGAAALRF